MIFAQYPNTAAFVIIGSVADGSWEENSDVDLVWVLRGKRRKRWHRELDYDYSGVVELVTLNVSELKRHFARHSSMAHSLQNGLVLYDPSGLMPPLLHRSLGQPTQEWRDEALSFFLQRLDWGIDLYKRSLNFHRRCCAEECHCHVSEILTRAVFNLARLLLIFRGIVPNSKRDFRLHYPAHLHSRRLRYALEIALTAHHEKRDLSLDEAKELILLGRRLRQRLIRASTIKPNSEEP